MPMRAHYLPQRVGDDEGIKVVKLDFQRQLSTDLSKATTEGAAHVDISAGDLHRELGVNPERGNSMPLCCSLMRHEMGDRDIVIRQPPKGDGSALTIRYRLPR